MRPIHKFVLLSLIAALLTTGCAPDRTEEDFRRERLQEEISKLNQFSGVYQGPLNQGSESIGTLVFEVTPTTRIQPGGGSPVAEEQAVIRGMIYLSQDHRSPNGRNELAMMAYREGYLDSSTGLFSIEFLARSEATSPEASSRLRMTGKISNGIATGILIATEDGNRYSFELSQEGAAQLRDQLISPPAASDDRFRTPLIDTYTDGKITMTIQQDDLNPESRLLSRLLSVNLVDVTFGMHDDAMAVFSRATIDTRTGLLKGRLEINNASVRNLINLHCNRTQLGYDCKYLINHTNNQGIYRLEKVAQ